MKKQLVLFVLACTLLMSLGAWAAGPYATGELTPMPAADTSFESAGVQQGPASVIERPVAQLKGILPKRLVKATEREGMEVVRVRNTGSVVAVFVPTRILKKYGPAPLHWFDGDSGGVEAFVDQFRRLNGLTAGADLTRLNPRADGGYYVPIAYAAPAPATPSAPSAQAAGAADEALLVEVKRVIGGVPRFNGVVVSAATVSQEWCGTHTVVYLLVPKKQIPLGSGAWHYLPPQLDLGGKCGLAQERPELAFLDLFAKANRAQIEDVLADGDWRKLHHGDWRVPVLTQKV